MRSFMIRYKILRLVNKIKKIRQKFSDYQCDLQVRNITYHNGKLDTERLFDDYVQSKNAEIFSIKRQIVSLKNKLK